MLVKGAGQLLNHQNAKKSESSRRSDDKSFQDVLDNTQARKKRKPLQKVAKKSVSKRKSNDNDSYDSNEKTLRNDSKPKKLKENLGHKQPVAQKSLMNKSNEPVAKSLSDISDKMNQLQAKREAALTAVGGLEAGKASQGEVTLSEQASQLLKDGKLNKESLLSNNLSDSKLKALEKNIEKLEKFEKSFSDYVSTEVNKAKAATDAKGLKALSGQGTMKIPQEMKVESGTKQLQFGESLEAQNTQGIQGIKLNNLTDDRGTSEQGADLNSMFAQGIEQESSVDQNQSSFVEAMKEADMGGQKSEKIENMQSIVRQARAFVKDGGGTMKMELSPEGMGRVHLKVAVDNGQVNVEMLADNQVAKKALEEGLAEIKTALEGQKLMVDTLKVEMAQDIQTDFSDMRDHMQEQANRDFAEDFLGQFRQDREAKHGVLFDGFRNFNPGAKEPVLNLNSQNNPYASQGKGRTLNVVA